MLKLCPGTYTEAVFPNLHISLCESTASLQIDIVFAAAQRIARSAIMLTNQVVGNAAAASASSPASFLSSFSSYKFYTRARTIGGLAAPKSYHRRIVSSWRKPVWFSETRIEATVLPSLRPARALHDERTKPSRPIIVQCSKRTERSQEKGSNWRSSDSI